MWRRLMGAGIGILTGTVVFTRLPFLVVGRIEAADARPVNRGGRDTFV
jgi:hypothetical protein